VAPNHVSIAMAPAARIFAMPGFEGEAVVIKGETPRDRDRRVPPGDGPPWTTPRTTGRKSVPLACILSAVLPGLGQVYVGFYRMGAILLGTFALLIVMVSNGDGALAPLFGLGIAFTYFFTIIDAGRRASLYNDALLGLGSAADVQELISRGRGGSVAGGLLLETRFDFDMTWLEDWWPVGLIGLGAYVLRQGLRNRQD